MKIFGVNHGTQWELAALICRLWGHLSPLRKRQFMWLGALLPLGGVVEVVSLGAVLPFLGVLISPEKIFENVHINKIASGLGIQSAQQLILPVVIAFVFFAVMAAAIRVGVLRFMTKLAFACGSDLSYKVYRVTLYQPYAVHIAQNSSKTIAGITNKVGGSVNVLLQLLILLNSLLIALFIVFAILLIDPKIALISVSIFASSYGLISWFAKKKLLSNSIVVAQYSERLQKALQEGLGGIRDVLLDGTQEFYSDIYRRADQKLRSAQSSNVVIGGIPRYFIEALGIALIALFSYVLSRGAGGVALALPVLGALALGAQRLLPSVQQIYQAWASIAGSQASLADALEMLDQPMPHDGDQRKEALDFERQIKFDSVSFEYTKEGPKILNRVSICIEKGSQVGLIGSTGGGKSTTLDLLMGLLEPTSGQILIDGLRLAKSKISSWQKNIAHVPQSIYLSDASLAENIAFGVDRSKIDMERVKKAADQAQLSNYIEGLPEAYETLTGERGVRLSGGQRQRIGIARALYKNSNILIFDEATSALDDETESMVMAAINGLRGKLTIIMVAHRLSTLRNCDCIIKIENGQIVATGKYENIITI